MQHLNLKKHLSAWLLFAIHFSILVGQSITHGELLFETIDTAEMNYYTGDTVGFVNKGHMQILCQDTDTTFVHERERDTVRYVFSPNKIVEYTSNGLLRIFDFENMISYNIRTSEDTSYVVGKFKIFDDWNRENFFCENRQIEKATLDYMNFKCRKISYLCEWKGQEKFINLLCTDEIEFSLPMVEPYIQDKKSCPVEILFKYNNGIRGRTRLVDVNRMSRMEVEEKIRKVEQAIFQK